MIFQIETCPKCGGTLMPLCYTTYPPIYAVRCLNCGWEHEEKRNEVVFSQFNLNNMLKGENSIN